MAFTFQIEIGNTKARKNEINKDFKIGKNGIEKYEI